MNSVISTPVNSSGPIIYSLFKQDDLGLSEHKIVYSAEELQFCIQNLGEPVSSDNLNSAVVSSSIRHSRSSVSFKDGTTVEILPVVLDMNKLQGRI